MGLRTVRVDTRRFPRVEANHLITYSPALIESPIDGPVGLGRTIDICEIGVRLETRRKFSRGDELWLEIALNEKIVRAAGTVVHVDPLDRGLFATGLRFTQLHDRGRELIRALA